MKSNDIFYEALSWKLIMYDVQAHIVYPEHLIGLMRFISHTTFETFVSLYQHIGAIKYDGLYL